MQGSHIASNQLGSFWTLSLVPRLVGTNIGDPAPARLVGSWLNPMMWLPYEKHHKNIGIEPKVDAPGLDHIFIWLGATPPSLPGLPARTCVGTLPHWEPMWQYPVKTTNIQVDITFIIPKLNDGVPSHVKYSRVGSQRGRGPTQVRGRRLGSEGRMGGAGASQMKMWSSPGQGRWALDTHFFLLANLSRL